MKVLSVRTAQALPPGQERKWAYNAMDCLATGEVGAKLLPRLDDRDRETYLFEMAAQTPAFAMTARGLRVNPIAHKEALKAADKELKAAIARTNKLPEIVENWDGIELESGACKSSSRKDGKHKWPRGVPDTPEKLCLDCGCSRFKPSKFNPNSDTQIKHLLYDLLGLPPQRDKEKKVTTGKEALQKLRDRFPAHQELLDGLLTVSDYAKQVGFLKFEPNPAGRYMSSFSIGGTWTGRQSSKDDPFGYGGNAQNIAERHRHIFEADPGREFCYIDYRQGESNIVAHLAGDEKYIEAHRTGDVHTYVTRVYWPHLDWTWDLTKDKKIAKQNPPWDSAPGHDYRLYSKKGQHGSNYGLTPRGLSIIEHIPLSEAPGMQRQYFGEFPYIRGWQDYTREKIQNQEPLVNPLDVRVRLFGRAHDERTFKQGLAVGPQGLLGHIIAVAEWLIWQEMDPEELELLAQIHDALLFQFDEHKYEVVQKAADIMRLPTMITDYRGNTREFRLDVEAAVGKNFGKRSPVNPFGLEEIEV